MDFNAHERTTPRGLTGPRALGASAAALVSSAVLLFFGTGLTPVAALAWIAPLPVLVLAPYVPARLALGTAFLAYVLSTANSWTFYPHSADEPLWPVGVLIIASFSLTFVLAVWGFRRLVVRGRPVLAALTAPALWVTVLYVISISNPKGIMGTLATTQADTPSVVKFASVAGWCGVEFLVMFVPTAVAALLSPSVNRAARVRTAITGAVVVGVAMGGGPLGRSPGDNNGHTQRVALIAPNHTTYNVDADTPAGRRLLDDYAEEIAKLPAATDHVVLPEGAFLVKGSDTGVVARPLARAARAANVDVVVGIGQKTAEHKYTKALAFPADGGEPIAYYKHHDLVSPPAHGLAHVPGTGRRVGLQICQDLNFADPSRDYAATGARLMLVPAADNGENGWQHSRSGVLRGVENGFSVAWSGWDGQLMIADGKGHVRAEDHTGGPARFTTVTAEVPDGRGKTLYTRFGDWFAWLMVLLGAGGLTASWFPGRRGHGCAADDRSEQTVRAVPGPHVRG